MIFIHLSIFDHLGLVVVWLNYQTNTNKKGDPQMQEYVLGGIFAVIFLSIVFSIGPVVIEELFNKH